MQNKTYFYRIGGVRLELDAPAFEETGTLPLFAEEASRPDHRIVVQMADVLPVPEPEPAYRDFFRCYYGAGPAGSRLVYDERDGQPLFLDEPLPDGEGRFILYRKGKEAYFGSHLAIDFLNLPELMPFYDAFFLHASWVELGGEALLFTALKQVGKSTQAALWKQYRGAETVNGDRVLLRRVNGAWLACGSPYCGTSDICHNRTMPVKGLVILSQGPESIAHRASPAQAFRALLDGASFEKRDRVTLEKMTELLGLAAAELPFYALSALPDESAVEALEKLF